MIHFHLRDTVTPLEVADALLSAIPSPGIRVERVVEGMVTLPCEVSQGSQVWYELSRSNDHKLFLGASQQRFEAPEGMRAYRFLDRYDYPPCLERVRAVLDQLGAVVVG